MRQHRFAASATELVNLLQVADLTDPGQVNAIYGDLDPFFNRGGKLITYVCISFGFRVRLRKGQVHVIGQVGLADPVIPPGATLWYYDVVTQTLGYDVSASYRMFTGNKGWHYYQ